MLSRRSSRTCNRRWISTGPGPGPPGLPGPLRPPRPLGIGSIRRADSAPARSTSTLERRVTSAGRLGLPLRSGPAARDRSLDCATPSGLCRDDRSPGVRSTACDGRTSTIRSRCGLRRMLGSVRVLGNSSPRLRKSTIVRSTVFRCSPSGRLRSACARAPFCGAAARGFVSSVLPATFFDCEPPACLDFASSARCALSCSISLRKASSFACCSASCFLACSTFSAIASADFWTSGSWAVAQTASGSDAANASALAMTH